MKNTRLEQQKQLEALLNNQWRCIKAIRYGR